MREFRLQLFWEDIPVGKHNAITYDDLERMWGMDKRSVRQVLQDLSKMDNGDDYVLIRSAKTKGFYRTDELEDIKAYRKECLSKGKSLFAPVRKINRVINANTEQLEISNNLRVVRELKNLKQSQVVRELQRLDTGIDKPMLSKMENNVCLPTPMQLSVIARIYGCEPKDLINVDLFM